MEHRTKQSQAKGTFENKNNVNETEQNKITTSGQSDNSTFKSNQLFKNKEPEKMDRDNFHHWEATGERMDIIKRRNNRPETRRLVKQRNALFRPGTLRRRYDQQTQTTIFAPSRPHKRSKQEIAEIDAELIRKANSIGGVYQKIGIDEEEEEPEEIREEGEIEQAAETKEDQARRTFTNCGFGKLQHRRQRSKIHRNKPHRRKTYHKQESSR